MSRNAGTRFALNPTISIGRSKFPRHSSHKTSFNVGELIPFYVDEVLPGDTFDVKTSKVVRMQSLVTPVMDNIYLDTYYFFVPNRLVWEHWKNFMGENTQSAWLPNVEYQVPQVISPASTGWTVGTIADYMGIPTGVPGLSVNALPFRAYALIYNEWFRDENLVDPLLVPVTDATQAGSNLGGIQNVANGGLPCKAAKYHDYFTSCLPAPQKGPDVTIPVATMQYNDVPVYSDPSANLAQSAATRYGVFPSDSLGSSVRAWQNLEGSYPNESGSVPAAVQGYTVGGSSVSPLGAYAAPVNLMAKTSSLVGDTAVAATINQLRMAFQIQKMYEKDARGGTRYIEILKSHFGVTSPDARLQRPEYLGGNRIPININQVLQQSQTTDTSPQGNPTGQSLTTDVHSDFRHSFVEHGFVIGLMVARYDHTYQQGVERFWSRKDRVDYYFPVLANIGEQAVLNKEIFAQGSAKDDEVFGYQEAWADYRYKPSRVSAEMRSSYAQSLDVWHLADYYDALPSLSASWIAEDSATVDRVLAVSERVSDQLFCDLYIQNYCTRPMPLYSIPGLIDHH